MTGLSHPYMLAGGVVLLLVGFLLWRWSQRHDLKGMAVDAAWQVAKARGDLAAKSELSRRLKDLQEDASQVSRAKKIAGYGVMHLIGQVAGLAGATAMLVGAGLVAAAWLWK